MIDFVNAIYGRMDTDLSLAEHNMPGMGSPLGAVPGQASARSSARGRFAGVPCRAHPRHRHRAPCHRRGPFGHGGMTRAHIADPQIVAQADARRGGAIRPCVGASHCHRVRASSPASTIRRRAASRSCRSRAPSPRPGRKVVVVGGGPAGLEAARVAAERGHEVVLFEAADRLGGQLFWRSARPGGAISSPSSTGAPPSWRGWGRGPSQHLCRC